MGKAIEPVVEPLGWDWRIGCGVVASFPAREVVIGTLGVIYNLGSDTDEESQPLHQKLQAATWSESGEPVFNIPVALSIMVFFALCAQCAATLVVIRRETNSWWWPSFTFLLHDRAGLRRSFGDVSGGNVLCRVNLIPRQSRGYGTMLSDWQTWIALLVVAAATAYVARRAAAVWRGGKASSCGSCNSCESTSGKQLPVVDFNGAAYPTSERQE